MWNKIKTFAKKKPVIIAGAIAVMVTLFFLLMRGRKAASSGTTTLTPGLQTNGSAVNQTDSGSILSAMKDMFTSFKQSNDAQLQQMQSDQANTNNGFASYLAFLATQINGIKQPIQQALPSGSYTRSDNGETYTPYAAISSGGDVISSPDYAAPSGTGTMTLTPSTSDSSIQNFINSAQNAISQASQNYFSAPDTSGQDAAHQNAEDTRQSVMDYFSSQPGYSVNTQDSGGGYSNVVVTAPDGSTTTF